MANPINDSRSELEEVVQVFSSILLGKNTVTGSNVIVKDKASQRIKVIHRRRESTVYWNNRGWIQTTKLLLANSTRKRAGAPKGPGEVIGIKS